MATFSMRRVVAHLDLAAFPLDGRSLDSSPLRCLGCRTKLSLHQPDPGDPDRMLGCCGSCGCWHLIRSESGSVTLLVALPVDLPLLCHEADDSTVDDGVAGSSRARPAGGTRL